MAQGEVQFPTEFPEFTPKPRKSSLGGNGLSPSTSSTGLASSASNVNRSSSASNLNSTSNLNRNSFSSSSSSNLNPSSSSEHAIQHKVPSTTAAVNNPYASTPYTYSNFFHDAAVKAAQMHDYYDHDEANNAETGASYADRVERKSAESRSSAESMGSNAEKHSMSVGDYVLGYTIGEGHAGKVKFATHKYIKNKVAAIKVIPKSGISNKKLIEKEVKILKSLHHPNILRLENAFEGAFYVYIIMEYAGVGELFDRITPNVPLDEWVAHFYFVQLINGMEYLHSQGICHRDLKPENLLINSYGNLKISDFGLSTHFITKGTRRVLETFCGSLPYLAPEVIKRKYEGDLVDIWACGIILFVLMSGNTPWDEPTEKSSEYSLFVTNNLNFEPWTQFTDQVRSLILGILQVNPQKRMTIKQIKDRPWFKRKNPFMNSELQCGNALELSKRIGVKLEVANMEVETAQPEGSACIIS